MRRTRERRQPKAHPARGRHDRSYLESCYRCRHGRGLIRCACRYARQATRDQGEGPVGGIAYAARLVAGLALLAGRRFGPGVALVAARGALPKLVPALAALPVLAKSAWAWAGGFSLAALTALTVGSTQAPATAVPQPRADRVCAPATEALEPTCELAVEPAAEPRARRTASARPPR